jgi:anti-sigma regulatory factor (Ser/Thr protein kinase)
MTPTITQTGFPTTEFSPKELSPVARLTSNSLRETWNRWGKKYLFSACIVATVVSIMMHLPTGLNNPMSAIALALVGFCVARVLGLINGVFAIAITILLSVHFQIFGSLETAGEIAVFTESFLIGICGSVAGSWIRDQDAKLLRFRQEKDQLQTLTAELEKRQRLLLRDVLAAVTSHRLHLCETVNELPTDLPSTLNMPPVALTSATLREIRAQVRAAGAHINMPEIAIGELVMAVSEAAMNAVVHARNGVAEVRVDTESRHIQVKIKDEGDGIDEHLLHRATLEAGFSSKGSLGQGFSLMVSCCRKVHLLTGKSGTTVVLEA